MKYTLDKTRPLSWSQITSFQYDKESWFDKYILGKEQESNPAMEFGKQIGTKLATDPTFLPEVLRYKEFEKKLMARIDDIILIGYLDSFCPDTKNFYEYKTSGNKTKWTQKSTQDHGQLLFYKFLIWKNYGIIPDKINSTLFYIPVETGGDFEYRLSDEPIKSFTVKHKIIDVLKFALKIKCVRKEMEEYVIHRSSID